MSFPHLEAERQGRRRSGCLSARDISLMASGAHPIGHAARLHLDGCAHCLQRLADETESVQVAVYERVPRRLFAAAAERGHGRWRVWQATGGFLAMACACLLAVTMAPRGVAATAAAGAQEDAVQSKGQAALLATVQRDGAEVAQDAPLDSLTALRAGDLLSLRLAGPLPPYIELAGWEESAWVAYYRGAAPAHRTLPVDVRITAQGETRVRFTACAAGPQGQRSATGCRAETYVLTGAPAPQGR